MPAIKFTQYIRPHGRPETVHIDRPAEIATMADAIIAAGYRFECEVLSDGHASFTVTDDEADHFIEIVPNGPRVPGAVDALVREAFAGLGLSDAGSAA